MSHGETQQDNEDYSKANRATTKTETSILVEKFVEDHYDEGFRYYGACQAKRMPRMQHRKYSSALE